MFEKKNDSGFGIIEVTLLIGLVSAMAYYLLSQQETSLKAKLRADFDLDVENTATLVRQILSDPYNCSSTAALQPAVGRISGAYLTPGQGLKGSAVGGDVSAIRLGSRNINFPAQPLSEIFVMGAAVIRNGQEIKPGLEVGAIHLLNDEVNDLIRIQFKYTPTKQVTAKVSRFLNRDFILDTKKEGKKITECTLHISEQDLERGCIKLKGLWNATDKKCTLQDPDYYLRSQDVVHLYDDGGGGFTINPPASPGISRCMCPLVSMCAPLTGAACCRPATCTGQSGGFAMTTEDPARKVLISGLCMSEAVCMPKPAGALIKTP